MTTTRPRHYCAPLAAGTKLGDVFTAIRDAGGRGATAAEITAATGWPGRQIGPILGSLLIAGHIHRNGARGHIGLWPRAVYVTARAAHTLGPAFRKDTTP